MKGLDHEICMRVLINKDMSLSEIQSSFLDISESTIIRSVNELVKDGRLEHKRIHGKKKRKRYTVQEEKIKNDMTIRAFKEKDMKKLRKMKNVDEILSHEIRGKITQRNLSSLISEAKRHYQITLRELKQRGIDEQYYTYHIAMISSCLEWTTRLTMAINSGMLGDSPNKLDLARRNRERYEYFLEQLCNNIKAKDEKLGKKIIKEIYGELVNLWFMEKVIG